MASACTGYRVRGRGRTPHEQHQHPGRVGGPAGHQSEWIDHAARIGLIAYGVVHLVIAWLAVQLALGDREGSADSQGAIQQLDEQPFGQALVWAVAIGMFLLALWQFLEALFGYRDEEGFTQVRKRVTAAGKAVVYVVIGVSAVRSATGLDDSRRRTAPTPRRPR